MRWVRMWGLLGALLPALAVAEGGAPEPLPIVGVPAGFYPFSAAEYGQKFLAIAALPGATLTEAKVEEVLAITLQRKAAPPASDVERVAATGHIGPDDLFQVEFQSIAQASTGRYQAHFYTDVPTFRLCVPFAEADEQKLAQQGWASVAAVAGNQHGRPSMHLYKRADGGQLKMSYEEPGRCLRSVEVMAVEKGAGKP